ncbi:MAG: AAA-like domain-containing protein [Coleofasciculaceae cyanobacterium]
MEYHSQESYITNGGAVPLDASTYVEREVDRQLPQLLKGTTNDSSMVFNILAPRQMGKSSLMVRTADRLIKEGLVSVRINLQALGGIKSEVALWFNLMEQICLKIAENQEIYDNDLGLKRKLVEDFRQYWDEQPENRSPAVSFEIFLKSILEQLNNRNLIIFIDEIHNLTLWKLQDDFIGFIKSLAEQKRDKVLNNLKFVFLGVTKPSELSTTPEVVLNLGEQVELSNLQGDCECLWGGLSRVTNNPRQVIKEILYWTGGQPFLTQLICHLAANHLSPGISNYKAEISKLVFERLIKNWKTQDRLSHFQEIQNRFVTTSSAQSKKQEKFKSLQLYEQIYQENQVFFNSQLNEHWDLLISGLVIKDENRQLKIANRIYKVIFNQEWLKTTQQQIMSQNLEFERENKKEMTNQQLTTIDDKSQKIASIIEKRRPLAEAIATVQGNLQSLSATITELESCRYQLLRQEVEPQVNNHLNNLSFSQFNNQIKSELTQLAALKARFSRQTLNIGVVGRARQGKSRLLQSLTGLDNTVIPSGDGLHCTGVRSTIEHKSSIEPYAEVYFHSEKSFLTEVIAPYYQELQLGDKPATVQEFAHNPLASFVGDDATAKAKYEHLKGYYSNFTQYAQLLQAPSPRQISRQEIREYVAQETAEGERIYFNYLAVKEVKIYCQFNKADVAKIALVDMPGLGDTGVGDEERLLRTLGQDVDFVLFVRMPKKLGDFWGKEDVELYDTANQALTDLPINKWSFLLLNHTNDNYHNCKNLAETRAENYLEVVECVTANCADTQEANRVLEQLLNYLLNNITYLDKEYANSCQKRLYQLQSAINTELEKAQQVWTEGLSADNEYRRYRQLFRQVWQNLTVGLNQLLNQLISQGEETGEDILLEKIETAISNCHNDTAIPSLEEIEVRQYAEGGYGIVYGRYLNELRAYITQHFEELNEGLKNCIDEEKSLVTEVLVNQGRLGELKQLSAIRGAEFLRVMAETVLDQQNKLKKPLQTLANFQMSYQLDFQAEIQKQMDSLNPNKSRFRLGANPSAEEVQAYLKANYQQAVGKCEEVLRDLSGKPRQVAFGVIKTFVDQVLRAEDIKDEWDILFYQERAQIWSAEFGDDKNSNDKQNWQNLVSRVATISQVKAIQFVK